MHYPYSSSQIDTLEESLHKYILAVADVLDELIALVQAKNFVEDDGADRGILWRYNELVQELRRLAHYYNLNGLQSVCALVENNMLQLQTSGHCLSDDEISALREWPELLLSYLMNQADEDSSTWFLNNLSAGWPICISEGTKSSALRLLMGETVPASASETAVKPISDIEPSQTAADIEVQQTSSDSEPQLSTSGTDQILAESNEESQQVTSDFWTQQDESSVELQQWVFSHDPQQTESEVVSQQADYSIDPEQAVSEFEPLQPAAGIALQQPASGTEQQAAVFSNEWQQPASDFGPHQAVSRVKKQQDQFELEPVQAASEAEPIQTESGIEVRREMFDIEPELVTAEVESQQAVTDTYSQHGDDDFDPQHVASDINLEQVAADFEPEQIVSGSEPQQIEQEMLSTLAAELALLEEQFHADLTESIRGSKNDRTEALTNYLDFLERLGFTLESVGLTALASIFEQLIHQIKMLDEGLCSEHQVLLQKLPEYLAEYLADPCREGSGSALLGLLRDSVWPSTPNEEMIAHWHEALANVRITECELLLETRAIHAGPEDVSLRIPEEVHPELLNGLLQELPVQVSAFSEAIEHISLGRGNVNDVERAMRAAHTLKGAANTVGVAGIANLTHHLEDILAALLNAKKLPLPTLSDVLINASDCLEAMSEFLQGIGPAPEHTLEVLQDVLDSANQIENLIVDEDMPDMKDVAPSDEENITNLVSPEQQPNPAQVNNEQSLRIPASLVDELLRISGETITTNSQIQERLNQSVNQTELIHKQHKLLQKLVTELEELVDIRGISAPQLITEHKGDNLDELEFEHYNELHTVTRRLMEAATDAQELTDFVENQLGALGEALDDQHRLQIANQNAVIRIRMVTVNSVVARLKRGVRQTARLLDKSVEFTIKGENTSIDGNVLNDLMDPLMHILRNAVDHGIESPDERIAAGKTPEGHIELNFSREGNSIVVRCSDDGKGLDYEAIQRSAEGKGMIKPEYDYSTEELERLILVPGFSTRGSASQVSGRGVGMDVVQSRIQEKKGVLTLKSRNGEGLTIELRLPATLLATHTLIVRQREKYLAISSRNIEDIRYCMRDEILKIGPRQFFRADENMCQLDMLENLLCMPHDRRAEYMDGFPVLLTRMNDGTMRAILVQEIMDSREVVMKKFGQYVPRTQGVVGAVILGNGSIAPVIDLVELLQKPSELISVSQSASLVSTDVDEPGRNARRALVVDDSLSARRAMTQVLVDAGYEVRTANDGLAAVDILSKFIPDIILSDMEMPRMNGLELTAHVRYAERTRHIPVIMITSRSTEKHRQMSSAAGVNLHIVKPFSDDTLLDHVARLTTQ